MQPDFDRQARKRGAIGVAAFNLDERATDLTVALLDCDDGTEYDLVSDALRAAYRAGMERAAQLADECGYGREAASKIREEIA